MAAIYACLWAIDVQCKIHLNYMKLGFNLTRLWFSRSIAYYVLSFQSISFSKSTSYQTVKMPSQEKLLMKIIIIKKTTSMLCNKECDGTWRSRQGSEAQCHALTHQSLELHLKIPSSSHFLCLFSSLCFQPWDAECTLSSFANSERGQGTKVTFKSLTPTIYMTPASSAELVSYWVHWFFINF